MTALYVTTAITPILPILVWLAITPIIIPPQILTTEQPSCQLIVPLVIPKMYGRRPLLTIITFIRCLVLTLKLPMTALPVTTAIIPTLPILVWLAIPPIIIPPQILTTEQPSCQLIVPLVTPKMLSLIHISEPTRPY